MTRPLKELTFADILKGKEYYMELIDMLGITKSVRPGNRIFKTYETLENLFSHVENGGTKQSYMREHGFDDSLLFVKVEAAELAMIFKELLNSGINTQILIRKIMEISGSTMLSHEETTEQNLARNTQFELSLYTEFLSKGFEVSLNDPNPDLSLRVDNVSYNIECKRIFSKNKLKTNIKKAREQLRQKLENTSDKGIIAISIDRLMVDPGWAYTPNDLMDKFEANRYLNNVISDDLKKYIIANQHIWHGDQKFQDLEIPAIIFQYRGLMTGRIIGQNVTTLRTIANGKSGDDPAYDIFLKSLHKNISF